MADTPYDPFDDFNRSHAIGVVRDPYSRLAELRRACGIQKASLRVMFGLIFRPQKTNVAFATGAHRCLGLHLARMESTVALDALLDRLPNLRLEPAAEDIHISGLSFRSPVTLPVLFEPSSSQTES